LVAGRCNVIHAKRGVRCGIDWVELARLEAGAHNGPDRRGHVTQRQHAGGDGVLQVPRREKSVAKLHVRPTLDGLGYSVSVVGGVVVAVNHVGNGTTG
jgi:hypothetical protein